jgi:hypothetical protein
LLRNVSQENEKLVLCFIKKKYLKNSFIFSSIEIEITLSEISVFKLLGIFFSNSQNKFEFKTNTFKYFPRNLYIGISRI